MFYTKVGRFIAAAVFWLSISQIVIGLGSIGNPPEVLEYYFGVRTTGQMIDRGSIGLVAAVVLGILTEISRHVRGRMTEPEIEE